MTPDRVTVHVAASDPISRAVMWSHVRAHPALVTVDDPEGADVVMIVTDVVDDVTLKTVRILATDHGVRVVLVASLLDPDSVHAAVDAGVHGILHRSEADATRVAAAVVSAAGGHVALPPDVLGMLLAHPAYRDPLAAAVLPVGIATANSLRLETLPAGAVPFGGDPGRTGRVWLLGTGLQFADGTPDTEPDEIPGPAGFTDRELNILRLVANGFGTAEIAVELSYSERTVKNAIHAVTERYNLRNRSHAVAYAMRVGAI